ncbi:hypothetical protein BGP_6390 [Beggiatoa sp. PS]|nr:hypothetical protein BGP_6390 [Beggiatoa sp. PS]
MVPVKSACEALGKFQSVKRRLELRGVIDNISVYDDFAIITTMSCTL